MKDVGFDDCRWKYSKYDKRLHVQVFLKSVMHMVCLLDKGF